MPQTSNGANGNQWIQYMRECAANYRAGHTQHHSVPGKVPVKEGRPAAAEASIPVKRRMTRKQPEPKLVNAGGKATTGKGNGEAKSKAKTQPITGQDLMKAVKKPKAELHDDTMRASKKLPMNCLCCSLA